MNAVKNLQHAFIQHFRSFKHLHMSIKSRKLVLENERETNQIRSKSNCLTFKN